MNDGEVVEEMVAIGREPERECGAELGKSKDGVSVVVEWFG